jgi:hypothetical protein
MGFLGGIASANKPDFQLDMAHFKMKLQEKWPDIQIKQVFEDDIDFGMTFKTGFDGFAGSTIKHHQIGWWSSYENFAEFITWYRSYVPADHQLLAWNKNFYSHLLITSNTTEDEILVCFSSNRINFEIIQSSSGSTTATTLHKRLTEDWTSELIIWGSDQSEIDWFLRSQEGYLKVNESTVYFSDTNLHFAAEFALWCRSILSDAQKLVARFEPFRKPAIETEINLNEFSKQADILRILTETFQGYVK